jgi:uncharacterized surface protein with fasciclin (FAS1) repeats
VPPPLGPNGQPIDYSVLINSPFDYLDLNQARAEGFSDSQIASIAKIASEAGVPFNEVAQLALNGLAFPTISDKYGLRTFDYLDNGDMLNRIAVYRAAYDNTGANDVRNLVAASEQERMTTPYGTTVVSNENIADFVNSSPDLTMFSRALRSARMMKVLRGPGPYTVFAPTDAAFAKLSTDQVNALMSDRNTLTKMLDYYIIPRRIDSTTALSMTAPASVTTLEGDALTVSSSNGMVMVNGADVVRPDNFATNGVVHEIDTVILPPTINQNGYMTNPNNTSTLAPSTTLTPNTSTVVTPYGTTTTVTPNGTTTVQPNGTTTVSPSTGNGGTIVTPSPDGSTTVTPNP